MARGVPVALVHESPYRVVELVSTIAQVLPDTRISASCDLTKLHELTIRGTAQEVLDMLQANPKADKGEYCLVLDFHSVTLPEEKPVSQEMSPEAMLLEQMLQGTSLRDAQNALTEAGLRKNVVKAAGIRLKNLLEELAE